MPEPTDPRAIPWSVIDPPATPADGSVDRVQPPRQTAAVAGAPRDFHLVYSLRDIHRLGFLSADERDVIRAEWRAWHRRHASLGAVGMLAWIAGAAAAWACSLAAGDTAAWIAAAIGWTMPVAALYAIAATLAVALLVALPMLFSTLAAAALCDAYAAGYADGTVTGVNRALQITPEREQEMWGELHDAEARDLRAARGRAFAARVQAGL